MRRTLPGLTEGIRPACIAPLASDKPSYGFNAALGKTRLKSAIGAIGCTAKCLLFEKPEREQQTASTFLGWREEWQPQGVKQIYDLLPRQSRSQRSCEARGLNSPSRPFREAGAILRCNEPFAHAN
jgi:hypothetical protein